jgi:acyl carrier protein
MILGDFLGIDYKKIMGSMTLHNDLSIDESDMEYIITEIKEFFDFDVDDNYNLTEFYSVDDLVNNVKEGVMNGYS